METVAIRSQAKRELELLGLAMRKSSEDMIEFLINHFHQTSLRGADDPSAPDGIAAYALYQGQRIEAIYDPATTGMTITSPPWKGQWFKSPSGAAKAVVATLKPGVSPNRSGWDFWFVARTGETLASMRNK